MKKVANRKVIRTLSYRTMREKKWKNLIAILAIALTSVLFTALFTVGGSMLTSFQESTFRQIGTSAHGGYKYLSMQEFEQIKAAGGFRDISCDIVAGFACNPELNAIQTEVRWAQDQAAKWSYCYPQEGRMPQEINECAVSSKVLEALKIPLAVGEKVPLNIFTHDENGQEKILEEEFVLSGFWYSNDASHAEELWISRSWLEENVSLLQENYNELAREGKHIYADGTIQAAVRFDSSFDLETQMQALTDRAGFSEDEVRISVNWGYATSSVDLTTALLGIGILGVIILSGYLIIYNIFYINVTADIRYYGLLKTLGTTGRQLRRMVRGQAFLLSAAGIPIGLLTGWFVGTGMLPALYAALETGGVRNISVNPLIFALSAVFSLFVVYLSCIRPCRLASRVSPIEAVRYVENIRYKKKERKSARLSMARIAAANMGRNKRKTTLVVVSLSLSLILLNGTYCLVRGFSFDRYVAQYLLKDMQVSHFSALNLSARERDYQALTSQILEELEEIPGVESASTVKNTYGTMELTPEMLKRYGEFYRSPEMQNDHGSWVSQLVDQAQETGEINTTNFSLDEELLPYLEALEGELDLGKFSRGGYAILISDHYSGWAPGSVGERVCVRGYRRATEPDGDPIPGPEKELEILAVADFPYSLGTRSWTLGNATLVICEKDFQELYQPEGALHACLDIREGMEEQAARAIDEWITSQHPELALTSKESLRKEFAQETNMFSVVGGMLAFILAVIGVLNLINAMITGILARKQEFAMMQAVGMTGRQLETMLTMEGLWYGILTLAVAATIGSVISYGLIYMLGRNMAFFEWRFHILPLAASVPVLGLLSAAIPVACYHAFCKKSIIERLRLAEV